MSLIRDSDEHWRDNVLGLSLNERLTKAISERHHREILSDKIERQILEIKNNTANPLGFEYNITESCFSAIINQKNKKILDIGFNTPGDLITDNFGIWWAAHLRGAGQGVATGCTLVNDANVQKTVGIYGVQSSFFNINQLDGTAFQAGSSTTAAARNDYKIGTALGSAPENAISPAGWGSYGVGTGMINSANVLTAGGSGTVNEIGLFGRWDSGGSQFNFMLFHDILSSGISYVATNGIVIAYGMTL